MAFETQLKIIIPLTILLVGIKYRERFEFYYKNILNFEENFYADNVFSASRLARYNGIEEKKLYLSVLGTVFDVSKGHQYYSEGSSYHYFVGKDGSRALVSGNFKDESKDKDHVLDLTCAEIFTIVDWKHTFKDKYEIVGLLHGRYYDRKGRETTYTKQLRDRIEECRDEKELARKHDLKYPPCNIAWSELEGTTVWCSKNSGGVARDWVGVPRQLYSPGQEKPQCVCLNLEQEYAEGQFKEYDKCPNTSAKCVVR